MFLGYKTNKTAVFEQGRQNFVDEIFHFIYVLQFFV